MAKNKRRNPAYEPGTNSRAWVLAGKCLRENISHNAMMDRARKQSNGEDNLPYDTEAARREIGYRRGSTASNLRRKIAERLPIRPGIKNLPFYLRLTYRNESGFAVGNTFIPDREYRGCINNYHYQPIFNMQDRLHSNRYNIMRRELDGLVRWTGTIDSNKCKFIITPSFEGFSFKINANTQNNKLPVIKVYGSVGITVRAPKEFFDQQFWGLGEHLVVQVLAKYENDDGVSILKTLSCDRENLYALEKPTILKERFYAQQGQRIGTGLTEQAAIKSLQNYLGKDVTRALGA